jgi:cobalamin biosynthesis Mg chelatase CobN
MDAAAGESHATAAMTQTKDEPHPPAQSALVEEAARVAVTLNEKLPQLSEESRPHDGHEAAPSRAREPQAREETASGALTPQASVREVNVAEPATESVAGGTAQAEMRGRIGRRAATVGASVGENLRPRVEKLREASTVVFDEATDDPGLRFVIVAVMLFLLFLFIFLFSYILG